MVGSDYTADVGSDFTPDVATGDAETINAQNAGINAEILRARPNRDTWLRRLARGIGIDDTDQSQAQTTSQQQQNAATAQRQATQSTDPGPGAAGSGAGYQAGPKSGQWQMSDPAAIGKGERAGRQSAAVGSLAHSVGTIVRLLVSMGAGGAMSAGGAGAGAGAGTGAASGAGAFMGADASGAATAAPATETLVPGGSPETAAVTGGMGGGSTGGGISQLARKYFGGDSSGGDTYSKIMNIMQQANQMGGGTYGGAGGEASSGVGGWGPQIQSEMSLASGKTQPRIKSLAELELGQAGLTQTGGAPGGGSNIPWWT